ncbi:DNA polymerase [Streptomyces sp. NPDC050095]|uniref:DNA polymerase n=1 Tax=unclassified Streptomyces TaxID=2593676 RepID=UPI00342067A0
MRILHYRIKRQEVRINVVEDPNDLPPFREWLASNPILGFDTETTGLDWWNADRGFRLRLVQFGNGMESWVLPVELGEPFQGAAREAIDRADRLIAHNAIFDQHVVRVGLGVPIAQLAPKTICTRITAHLVDPRAVKEGGPGLKLEELTAFYIDAKVAEEVKGSMAMIARKYKTTKNRIWPIVELFDEDFLLYAGMDPILAHRLFHTLWPAMRARSKTKGLFGWEHRLNHVTGLMEETGYLVDEDYALMRVDELTTEQNRWVEEARRWGIENVNSDKQLIEAFLGFGYKLTKKTPKGNWSMDSEVLDSIDHPLAEAVKKATKAAKWRTTWFENALRGRDSQGRVHPSINSIAARTARMTITGSVPAQTFPAGTGYVRHMFLAEEGHVSVAVDFANMELRFLAAMSQDPTMVEAFLNGKDLHQITADAAGVDRKVGKMGNFLIVFGGGWKALMTQARVPEEVARRTIGAFNSTYPQVEVIAKKLAAQARQHGGIYTITGRWLPVDRSRAYSAMNYYIQSGSRDITARAILNLHAAGYTPFMRLPIHDELIFSFPKTQAKEMTRDVARIMEFTIREVLVPADGEIGDRSWGSVLELEESKH